MVLYMLYTCLNACPSCLFRRAGEFEHVLPGNGLYFSFLYIDYIYVCGGSASNSNIETLERFQSRVLRIITDAAWYVPNAVIKRDLKVLSVRQTVRIYSVTDHQRLDDHPNRLAKSLFQGPAPNRRLKRCYPADLATP